MFWDIVYSLEPGTIFLIGYIGFKSYLKEKNVSNKKQTAILTSGMVFFLLTFFLSNFYGEITKVYEFNLWGPIGIFIFFILLVYMIVKFKTFDIKLLATQALVWALAILIGAQFFFIKVTVNFILNAFTFVAILFFGELLVESVKNEVKQREYLEQINLELQRLVKQRESLVHLVTHKVKGSFTRSKYLFSEMLDGTFGPLTPMLATMTKRGLESDIEGIATVDLVLNSANLQNGTVKYDMKPTDFKDIVEKLVAEKSKVAESRGLTMNMHSTQEPELHYTVLGDTFWLKEVVINLLENSIRYTRAGNIDVTLTEKDKKIVLCVKDTGVGITDEDKKNLFTEGGRGKDSVKINVDSTGYGLFSVKLIVEAHHGRIWAESAGADKGSAFYVEFDALA
jgi:signal transduction histidine kinase